jgi:hypothetical protein
MASLSLRDLPDHAACTACVAGRCSAHNPTGALPSRAEQEAMVSCCREHDLLLFCDEMCKCASARSDCAAQSSRQADRPRNALQAAAHGHAACTAADRLLEYDAADRLPAICDAYELGISLGGMSKAYAMPGAPPPPLSSPTLPVFHRLLVLA